MKRKSYTVQLNDVSEVYGQIFINTPEAIPDQVLIDMFDQTMYLRESIHAVYMDNSLMMRYHECIGIGNHDSVIFDIPQIFRTMIMQSLPSVILVHNHPSGTPKLSAADIHQAQKLKELCKLFGYRLLDFMAITPDLQRVSAKNKNLI